MRTGEVILEESGRYLAKSMEEALAKAHAYTKSEVHRLQQLSWNK